VRKAWYSSLTWGIKDIDIDQRDFVPGILKLYEKPSVLTGISRTLVIKGEGDVQFQVVMDNLNECEGDHHSNLLDPRNEVSIVFISVIL